ncbi:hypothetical protein, partial [Psychroserpens sp.]
GFGGSVKLFENTLDISIAANNITNERNINHLSRLKPDGILNIGRNFSFGLNYTLSQETVISKIVESNK